MENPLAHCPLRSVEETETRPIALAYFLERVILNGHYLERVPRDFRTHEIVVAAITKDPFAIQYLNREDRTKELMDLAISLEPKLGKYPK